MAEVITSTAVFSRPDLCTNLATHMSYKVPQTVSHYQIIRISY